MARAVTCLPCLFGTPALRELHVSSTQNIPFFVLFRLLRAALTINFFNVSVTALGGDDDLSEVMRPVISPMTRLGLMHGSSTVCDVLARAQFAFHTAALRDLDFRGAHTSSAVLLSSVAHTIQRIGFYRSCVSSSDISVNTQTVSIPSSINGGNPPIPPLPFLPLLHHVNIYLTVAESVKPSREAGTTIKVKTIFFNAATRDGLCSEGLCPVCTPPIIFHVRTTICNVLAFA
jgi:hypothetical protein